MPHESTAYQIGCRWPGFDKIKHIVIFGASYCEVGYSPRSPHPTPENPLGVPFPGLTSNEPEEPNWVGYLTKIYESRGPKLIYDYALGGDRVFGVRRQVQQWFLPDVGAHPDWAPWTSEDTLFITWIGINDCAWGGDYEEPMTRLFEYQEDLYAAGARNFLFIDVPPMHRAPATTSRSESRASNYERWNDVLEDHVMGLAGDRADISAMIFSSWDTFTRVLDDPPAHGFDREDESRVGSIWFDRIHPTSKMHDIIARELSEFLDSLEPYQDDIPENINDKVNVHGGERWR
ncbi:hypothetical protein CONPUDRAFT_134360 [Coniophora puteana RWD-64-598 SS2]|uniref:SGNH hydrolase-type esterase domain-containing protein n=1 Tax=Coniophora puteana (strain RWD-64-598) TaxID=741705 RepID=A0A5M3N849_CONPW|nr:uncharacterized protein CONPUDRAFT_134360 [Coniophora puteana RWD-64-598 SS2]EIW87468.1 hypothetical protein CONPUDRAFT_134360 [Coniophora puteana RWD-64-598 SS2]